METLPKISIITVVRNGENDIENTIKSIISQTYTNVEYIIIDGKSTDGTVDIIKKYQHHLSYWISEKDKGIYDAMNKGVIASTGDWLLFINSDDSLASDDVLQKAVKYLQECTDKIAYGNIIYVYPGEKEVEYGPAWESTKYRFRNVAMSLAHQATFHSKALFTERHFDTSFKIAGDYDFLLSHLKDHEATYFPVTIAKMKTGGLSYSVSKIELLRDTRKAQIQNKMYNSIPSIAWIVSATKLLLVDFIIRNVGVDGKNTLKKWLGIRKR
ncbi:glycosyltransferase family 2 protein [Dyadobacter luticola]|uniref:Glycosyltransferase n=1 Tax=Dyadobacter luticola TaxID=1979387 RepID=A0A5R9KX04_9BACT|nr:glycosyltransferase family 2 protein [Dyadobacter luticola]TLV00784.1 glycosyltransferase [Dyadobacter luticola]